MNYKKIIIEHDDEKRIDIQVFKNLNINIKEELKRFSLEYDPKKIDHSDLLLKIKNLDIVIKDIKTEEANLEKVFIKLVNE